MVVPGGMGFSINGPGAALMSNSGNSAASPAIIAHTKAGRKEFGDEYPHSSREPAIDLMRGCTGGKNHKLATAIVRSIFDALRVHPCSCMRPRRVLPLRESA